MITFIWIAGILLIIIAFLVNGRRTVNKLEEEHDSILSDCENDNDILHKKINELVVENEKLVLAIRARERTIEALERAKMRSCPHCGKYLKKSFTGKICYHCNKPV